MRQVYLEPNTDENWGWVMDVEGECAVQCWRTATRLMGHTQGACHRGCAALLVEEGRCWCLAMPTTQAFAEVVEAPAEEEAMDGVRAARECEQKCSLCVHWSDAEVHCALAMEQPWGCGGEFYEGGD